MAGFLHTRRPMRPRPRRPSPVLQLATLLWLWPPSVRVAHAQDADWQPPSAAHRHSALLISGLSTFAASYTTTALLGAGMAAMDADDCKYEGDAPCAEWRKLYVPVVGPLNCRDLTPGMKLYFTGTQILGLVATAIGLVVYAQPPAHGLRFAASGGPGELQLRVSLGF